LCRVSDPADNYYINNGICIPCSPQTYTASDHLSCTPCSDPNCIYCFNNRGNGEQCHTCNSNDRYILKTQTTCERCPEGKFAMIRGGVCTLCSSEMPGCLKCATVADFNKIVNYANIGEHKRFICLECDVANGWRLENEACTSCPDGQYYSSGCKVCDQVCSTCVTTATTCKACNYTYSYQSSTNICSPCVIGKYGVSTSGC